jgi:hypothetical protein
MVIIIFSYPATTTVASIRFHPLLRYDPACNTKPIAKILKKASIIKTVVTAKLTLSIT